MGLLDLCEKYYNTKNLYEILQITEEASDKEVKKAYHKLSLKVHPDRVGNDQKLEATEKFKVLSNIHEILSNKNKRALYDQTKSVDEDDYNITEERDWTIYWRLLFKKITVEDIKAYENEYIGSAEEKKDLKHAYLAGKGDMDYIVDQVQFARTEHEPRIREIFNEMIKNEEIPSYKIFTHEPEKKRRKRIAKENREAKEAEEMKNEIGLQVGIDKESSSGENSLQLMIKQNQQARAVKIDSFIDGLAAKYGEQTQTKKRKTSKTNTTNKNKKRKVK